MQQMQQNLLFKSLLKIAGGTFHNDISLQSFFDVKVCWYSVKWHLLLWPQEELNKRSAYWAFQSQEVFVSWYRAVPIHTITIVCLNKVITTMMIGPLDDHTYCTRSAFTHLELWRMLYYCLLHHFTTCQCILKCALLTFSSTSSRLAEIWKSIR